jgi:uncharacterized membrane-anchored protein
MYVQVVWNAKAMLQAIRAGGALRKSLRLGQGLIDIRIAGWMLNPDSPKVTLLSTSKQLHA